MAQATSIQNSKFELNLILIGNIAGGKTSILMRHTSQKFDPETMTTIGVSFVSYKYKSNNSQNMCNFQIWDTAGQERYGAIVRSYFTKADGVVLVFDLADKKSFTDMRDWIAQVRQASGKGDTKIPMVMVGNKLDLCDGEGVSSR